MYVKEEGEEERRRERERGREQESKKAGEQEKEEGANCPFYCVRWGYLSVERGMLGCGQ